MFKLQRIFVVLKTTSNVKRGFESGTAPLYHSDFPDEKDSSVGELCSLSDKGSGDNRSPHKSKPVCWQ